MVQHGAPTGCAPGAPGSQHRGRVGFDMEDRGSFPWPLSDRVVTLRPPRAGEEHVLVADRDPEGERWLGPGEGLPRPTAVVLVVGKIVGWVDYDTDRDWLGPTRSTLAITSSPLIVAAVTPAERCACSLASYGTTRTTGAPTLS